MKRREASPRLAAVLRALGLPEAPEPQAHAEAMLRALTLDELSSVFAGAGLEAMLVKGSALALTVYPEPALRTMADLDLLVRPEDFEAATTALLRAGFPQRPGEERPLSEAWLADRSFVVPHGAWALVVEIHPTLDKIAPRRLDTAALFARARPLEGKPALLLPDPADHAVLVALHAAGHEFHHPWAFADLAALLEAGLDPEAFAARAEALSCRSATFVALGTLSGLGYPVPEALLARLDPGPLRRAAIGRFYRLGAHPPALHPFRYGLPWALRQTVLRDDLAVYGAGILRYAALRALERGPWRVARGRGKMPAP